VSGVPEIGTVWSGAESSVMAVFQRIMSADLVWGMVKTVLALYLGVMIVHYLLRGWDVLLSPNPTWMAGEVGPRRSARYMDAQGFVSEHGRIVGMQPLRPSVEADLLGPSARQRKQTKAWERFDRDVAKSWWSVDLDDPQYYGEE